jgi:hypothetical protein
MSVPTADEVTAWGHKLAEIRVERPRRRMNAMHAFT